jgi:hypothetical protein
MSLGNRSSYNNITYINNRRYSNVHLLHPARNQISFVKHPPEKILTPPPQPIIPQIQSHQQQIQHQQQQPPSKQRKV